VLSPFTIFQHDLLSLLLFINQQNVLSKILKIEKNMMLND